MGRLNGYNTIFQFTNSYKEALFICLLFISFPMGMSDLRSYQCNNDTTYLVGSMYERNLKSVLDDLVKNAPKTGFNTSSRGENAEEKVYGLLQCRGDASPQDCSACSQEASIILQQLCVKATGGRVWLDICFLRYDNFSFFPLIDALVSSVLSNSQTVEDNPAAFQNEVMDLLRNLTHKTANLTSKRFAADSVTSSSSDGHKIFGMVECWRNLYIEQCISCLSIALKRLYPFTVKEGGEALLGSCRVRYETYRFSTLFADSPSVHQRKSWRKVSILCGGGGVVLLTFICLFLLRNKMRCAIMKRLILLRQTEDPVRREGFSGSLFNPQMMFSLDTLIEATGHFHEDNKVGEGGFGSVYKGITSDGTAIAVKKLSLRSTQGTSEFMNEVKLVAKIQHRNLVQLLGCCVDGPERLLVYEYLPNKSLDTFLFHPEKRKVLDWQIRYNIIIGIARGLLYLHQDSQLRIIHRDVKANNILLDDKLNPKISDFGLARLFADDETHVHTRVAGTCGYMAPEYAMSGQLSVKADVYSFGVLLLEIVSGRRNFDTRLPEEMQNLLKWVRILCNGENDLLNMIDPTIVDCFPREQSVKCIHVGLQCIQEDAANRPEMSAVVLMLSTNYSLAIPNPAKPAFVNSSFDRLSYSTISGCDFSSINSVEGR